MENILRKSDLTVGKLQMQVVDKGFYFVFQKHHRGANLTEYTALLDGRAVGWN